MANTKDTLIYFLNKIGNSTHITTKNERGECKLYADGREVALIVDDLLYIPICEASASLENICAKDVPFLGAKMHYVIDEGEVGTIRNLSKILLAIAKAK